MLWIPFGLCLLLAGMIVIGVIIGPDDKTGR